MSIYSSQIYTDDLVCRKGEIYAPDSTYAIFAIVLVGYATRAKNNEKYGEKTSLGGNNSSSICHVTFLAYQVLPHNGVVNRT